jgi:hypothetical protein
MAHNEKLTERIRKILSRKQKIVEKKMFGGVCFMHRGNMMCGVEKKRLMVRVGPDQYEDALTRKHASVMDLTGVPFKGFIFVNPVGLKNEKDLKKWLDYGLRFTSTLPEKAAKKKKK